MRSSAIAEKAGVRSVSIVCSGFIGEAQVIARLSGLQGSVLAEYPGHVSMDSDEDFRQKISTVVTERVIAGLTGRPPKG
jgi:hypothetical protein